MACAICLHIVILSFGIATVFNYDEYTTTQEPLTESPAVTTTTTTTEEPLDHFVDENEYDTVVQEYCISYDDECQRGVVLTRLRSKEHNTSHSRGLMGKSKLLTKLTGTKNATEINSTASKTENINTTVSELNG